jgi:DNA repair ATPase RecN
MLKTFAILLSLGTAYSTATYAMNSYEELAKASQRIRNADEAFSRIMQSTHDEKETKRAALKQMQEKLAVEDQKLMEATFKNMEALNDLTMSPEESSRITREFEALKQSVITAKQAAVDEFETLFGDN